MNSLRYDYLLPIGSIVKVKDIEQRMMIVGVLQRGKAAPEKCFDYAAVPYPEGLHDIHLNIGFDHNNIEEVVFRGYEDKERKAFLVLLEILSRKADKRKDSSIPQGNC